MHIYWHGISCVKIQTHDSVCIFNPYSDSVGLVMPKLKADVVVVSDKDSEQSNGAQRLQGEPFVVATAGEFEIKGIHIQGAEYADGSVLYLGKAEGMTFAHLGAAAQALSDQHIELLEGVDILFLPLACRGEITPDKIVSILEPRIVIPVAYATPRVKIDLPDSGAFFNDMGVKGAEPEEKLLIKLKDLPQEEMQVKVLKVA